MDGDSVTVERVIPAPPEAIFRLLSDANEHPRFDGSGSVRSAQNAPQQLSLGSTFGMSMRQGISYSVMNEVVEFQDNRRIGWRPKSAGIVGKVVPAGRVWRYELEPVDGGTRVRETWDISGDGLRFLFRRGRLSEKVRTDMEKTLERLEGLVAGPG